jgi:DNA-directed RNA polymerase specialized sigma24 family protein
MPRVEQQERCDEGELSGSAAKAIAKFLQGDDTELGDILVSILGQLVGVARRRLINVPHTDEEAAAMNALRTFITGVRTGKFSDVRTTDQLRWLLITIADRKAIEQIRRLKSYKGGSGQVSNEPANGLDGQAQEDSPVEQAIGHEWLEYMENRGLRQAAELVAAGCIYREIAKEMGITNAEARRLKTLVRKRTFAFFGLAEND